MIKTVFEKIKYELGILLFLLLQFFLFLPPIESSNIWPFISYLGNYDNGFMPRALIGEIISWFTDFCSHKMLYSLSVAVSVLLCFAISLLGGQLIKASENKTTVISLVAIMVCSPVFMPLFASWLGVTDIYMILITLTAFAFNENKFLRFLIPVLLLAATAIHHIYLLLYMVPVAIALLYDFFKNKKYLRDGILCSVTYISLIAFGLICATNNYIDSFGSIDSIIEFALNKTDMDIQQTWLEQLMPSENFSQASSLLERFTSNMSVSNLLGIILIFAPILILFACGWIKILKKSDDKAEKFVFFLCLIQPVSTVPAYIFALNWNRWTSSIITAQCMLYLFMLYRKSPAVISVTNDITAFFKKHFAIVIFYLIYFASFAKLLGS